MAQLMPLPLTVACSSKKNPDWFYLSGTGGLTKVVLERRPLNGCCLCLLYRLLRVLVSAVLLVHAGEPHGRVLLRAALVPVRMFRAVPRRDADQAAHHARHPRTYISAARRNQGGYIFYAGASLAGAGYCRQCRPQPAVLPLQLWQGCQVCVKISAQRLPRVAQFYAC